MTQRQPHRYVLGIDLGTTNSCLAVLEPGAATPTVIEAAEGGRTTPSVVARTRAGERLIGQVARRQALTNPTQTLASLKRLMGRRFDDPDVAAHAARVPYAVVPGPRGDAWVRLGDADYAPPQIAAMILAKLKADAEARLGQPVQQAVITVPAYFDDAQRQATKDAGRIAGLEVLRILNEPTAAALAYGLGLGPGPDPDRTSRSALEPTAAHAAAPAAPAAPAAQTIAVYDLGGGTFDISLLHLDPAEGLFEVKSTAGDTHLGGDDFDAAIVAWLLEEAERAHGLDLRADPLVRQRLAEAAEKAKIELSSLLVSEIALPFLAVGPEGPVHLQTSLTRAKLEGLVAPLIAATAQPCRQALADADLSAAEIDAVLLVGGQTRMPAVQAAVAELFGRAPSKAVNPDEVVALGAALQGAALAGQVADVLLLDVTPLTLGVETQGGGVAPLIGRNTPVPVKRSEVFTTGQDGQRTVEVHVVQGERPLARENQSLARLALEGLAPAARGVAQIEVAFTLDANGLLSVRATDRVSGQAQALTVTPASGLSAAEVAAMVDDAARYRAHDRTREVAIVARNEADALIYYAARVVREAGENLDVTRRENLEALVDGLEASLPTGDMPQIRERMQRVQDAVEAIREQDATGPLAVTLPA